MARLKDFRFNNLTKVRSKRLKKRTVKKIGKRAENFYKDNFRRQGFLDSKVNKWKRRKGNTDPGRAILVKSGTLRNSIRNTRNTDKRATIQTEGVKYAYIHNFGGKAGRKRRAKIPQRRFIGKSKKLDKEIRNIIKDEFKNVF